ncbi:metallophosphoesterase [Moraxella sp. 179-F 1C4 NHS]
MINNVTKYKIVHISDLHINHTLDNERVFNAFLKDLSQQNLIEGILVISGDITDKGNYKTDQVKLIEERINILQSTLPKFEIIFTPGNHDINLKRLDIAVQGHINKLTNGNSFIESINENNSNFYLSHLADYFEIVKKFEQNYKNFSDLHFTKIVNVGNHKIGFASINTAWSAGGKGEDDYGKILVGERQIDLALKELKDCELLIGVMHHTFDWISLKEKTLIQNSISRNFDIILCGHNHQPNASSTISNLGNVVVNNTGCLYQSRDWFNGYSIITIDSVNLTFDTMSIEAREYYMDRDKFDNSIRFSEQGQQVIELKKNIKSIEIVIPNQVYEKIDEDISRKLLSPSSRFSSINIDDIFVEPPLSYTDEKRFYSKKQVNIKPEDTSKDFTNLKELANEKTNILIFGKKESGKSTLIDYICSQRFLDFHSDAQLAIVVDLNRLKLSDKGNLNDNSVLTIMASYVDGEISKADLRKLLDNGKLLICFDNINFDKPSQIKLIAEFTSKYLKCRYICTAMENINDEILVKKDKVLDNFDTTIYIHSFKDEHTQKLAGKWFDSKSAREKYTIMVVQILSRLNVPSTPFLISALLWVIEQNSFSEKLINQTAVIETLLDGLLKKFQESKHRGSVDSKVISNFLSEFSLLLDTRQQEFILRDDFDRFTTRFFANRSLPQPKDFIDDIINKGILYESSSYISFKFDCFRAFYLAKKFNDNDQLWIDIIDSNKYSKYYMEFDFLTALERNKKDVLIRLGEKCKEKNRRKDEDKILSRPLESVEISIETLDTNFEDPEIVLEQNTNSTEVIFDIDRPSSASINPDRSRQRKVLRSESEDNEWMSIVILYSVALRNSELIDNKSNIKIIELKGNDDGINNYSGDLINVESNSENSKDDNGLKSSSLEEILFNWALIIVNYLNKLKDKDILSELEDSSIANSLKKLSINKGDIIESKDSINFILENLTCMALISGMSAQLATPKLSIVLQELIDKEFNKEAIVNNNDDNKDNNEPCNIKYEYIKILAFFILMDADIHTAIENFNKIIPEISKHKLLKNLLFFKMSFLFVSEEDKQMIDRLSKCIIDLEISKMGSLKSNQADIIRQRFKQKLHLHRKQARNELSQFNINF